MADLTRFDFNAHDFLNSETVEVMSDSEVGQYILLLAKSWLIAKDASLPDDAALLAKWAHCRKVSAMVLEKFPITDTNWGSRRQNPVLYQEWMKAALRAEAASEKGTRMAATRWSASCKERPDEDHKESTVDGTFRASDAMPNRIPGVVSQVGNRMVPYTEKSVTNSSAVSVYSASKRACYKHATSNTCSNAPIQTNPNQSKPIQTNPNQFTTSSYPPGNFKTIRTRWYSFFRKDLAKSALNKAQYDEACQKFGEDWILEKLDVWAPENMWVADSPKGNNRLYVFLESLPVLREGDSLRDSRQTSTVASAEPDTMPEDVKRAMTDRDRDIEETLEQIRREKELLESNADTI